MIYFKKRSHSRLLNKLFFRLRVGGCLLAFLFSVSAQTALTAATNSNPAVSQKVQVSNGRDSTRERSPSAESENGYGLLVKDAIVRKYMIEFTGGTQATNEFPIYHWGFNVNSTSFDHIFYDVNYDNFYGSTATNFLFSPEFSQLGIKARYQPSWWYVMGGLHTILLFNQIDQGLGTGLGFQPAFGGGVKFPNLFWGFGVESRIVSIIFRDGFWLDFEATVTYELRLNMDLTAGYINRISLADSVNSWENSVAKIPYIGVRIHWE